MTFFSPSILNQSRNFLNNQRLKRYYGNTEKITHFLRKLKNLISRFFQKQVTLFLSVKRRLCDIQLFKLKDVRFISSNGINLRKFGAAQLKSLDSHEIIICYWYVLSNVRLICKSLNVCCLCVLQKVCDRGNITWGFFDFKG